MTEELSRTRLYINTPLNKTNGSGIPLINLDWGSTNLPLKSVDEEVMKRTWAIHGNPGSCGSYTGGISKMTIEEVSRSVLKFLNVRGEVFYGGAGASYWLERIAERNSGSRLMLIQTEVHDALIRGWSNIDHYNPSLSDQCTWVRRMCLKYKPQNLVLGISLSSHLTGATFEDCSGVLSFCKDMGVRVLIDATCYIAHHSKPEIPHFDYLVFSPHKLPGGPGSCGVMVAGESVNWGTEPGSQNIPGIIRIEECIRVFRDIKEPEGVSERIRRFATELGSLKEGAFAIEIMHWDDMKITEPHFSFKITWKSPDMSNLQVHPNLVSMICTHIYGLQIRGGGMCAESFLTDNREGIMKRGVCRISVPRYLFTEELSKLILEKFRDMIKYMGYYIRCYHIGKQGGWEIRPEIAFKRQEPSPNTSLKTCCQGPQSSYFITLGKDEPLRGGMMVIDWLFPDVWSKMSATKLTDEYIDDPDRWFLHPNDLNYISSDI